MEVWKMGEKLKATDYKEKLQKTYKRQNEHIKNNYFC